jgi:hypothetical protein
MNEPIHKVLSDGTQIWYLGGDIVRHHRIDGPAIIFPSGRKCWIQYGRKHREDGPAIEDDVAGPEWWVQGKGIPVKTQQEFEQYMRMKAFW